MLKKYDIGLILLEDLVPVKLSWAEKYWLGADENKINQQENYLIKYLDNSPGWRKIYFDSLSLIYIKNNF